MHLLSIHDHHEQINPNNCTGTERSENCIYHVVEVKKDMDGVTLEFPVNRSNDCRDRFFHSTDGGFQGAGIHLSAFVQSRHQYQNVDCNHPQKPQVLQFSIAILHLSLHIIIIKILYQTTKCENNNLVKLDEWNWNIIEKKLSHLVRTHFCVFHSEREGEKNNNGSRTLSSFLAF